MLLLCANHTLTLIRHYKCVKIVPTGFTTKGAENMPTIREVKTELRYREWAEQIQECPSSGMTVTAWCKENGISQHTYYSRLNVVRKELLKRAELPLQQIVPLSFSQISSESFNASSLNSLLYFIVVFPFRFYYLYSTRFWGVCRLLFQYNISVFVSDIILTIKKYSFSVRIYNRNTFL